jgi:CRP-like cAMP-binding protein
LFKKIIENTETSKTFAKGEVLQCAGQHSSKIFYVKKGLLRSYTIDSKGKEHILMFASEDWIVSDVESHIFGNDTVLFIDAIEDSEVYEVSLDGFHFADNTPDGYEVAIDTLLKRIGVMQRRILALMSESAKERYESFLQIYPELPNRVPQKMIASYLGITPEALSKIRGEIAKS